MPKVIKSFLIVLFFAFLSSVFNIFYGKRRVMSCELWVFRQKNKRTCFLFSGHRPLYSKTANNIFAVTEGHVFCFWIFCSSVKSHCSRLIAHRSKTVNIHKQRWEVTLIILKRCFFNWEKRDGKRNYAVTLRLWWCKWMSNFKL